MNEKATGKEAVMQAVIEAACDLFSEKVPSKVSIREIAEKAGVNHGLIHRHFGSKRNLILHVLDYIDSRIRSGSQTGGRFTEVFKLASEVAFSDARFWRIPANLIMDGEARAAAGKRVFLPSRSEGDCREGLRPRRVSGFPAEESIFLLIALGFGTEMFGDYISRSMKIPQPDIRIVLKRILEMVPGG